MGVEPQIYRGEKHKNVPDYIFWNSSYLLIILVSLRGPSAKHFWDGIEQFGEHLEELGVGDEEVKNV